MKIQLTQDSYGKSAVRVAKITRHGDYHEFKEVHVAIQLEGDFETVYSEGDNSKVLPTDTMKNTIFGLAKDHPLHTIEDFGLFLADYFLKNNPQVAKVTLDLTQIRWDRMTLNGVPHPYSYVGGGNEKATANVQSTRRETQLRSGISELRILKTTHSGFENYIVDQFTTLPPAADRILATELEAIWNYNAPNGHDFQKTREKIREDLLTAFAAHHSRSVQHTLYAMGEAVLKHTPAVSEISMKMPNLHYLPVNMAPWGLTNKNEIFVASGDAYGYITGTLKREDI
ncbi:MAG: factor-independent urate hydroxylase [Saprospiraceae bacterium]